MDPAAVVFVTLCVIAYGLVSRRVENTSLTPPILFVAAGVLASPLGLDLIQVELEGEATHRIIEVTLVLVLFSDAARISLPALRRGFRLPARLLLVGLPLTIGFGFLLAWPLFPHFSYAELALLAAILAPTDAALGQVVVSSPIVPACVRQALNVESGLNDGIAVPIVTTLLAVAAVSLEVTAASQAAADWESVARFAGAQVLLGPVAGIGVALPAASLIQRAIAKGGVLHAYRHFSGIAIAFGAFGVAELIGGNGFIAAFTAGIIVGRTSPEICESLQEFAEEEGQLLALITFLIFGAAMVPAAISSMDWQVVTYTVLSLTVVRMVPVALSLLGTGLRVPSVGFIGWFGPRGLATILFALLVLESSQIVNHEKIFHIAALAVLASTVLHGLTAAPLARRYSTWLGTLHSQDSPVVEQQAVAELPARIRMGRPERASDGEE